MSTKKSPYICYGEKIDGSTTDHSTHRTLSGAEKKARHLEACYRRLRYEISVVIGELRDDGMTYRRIERDDA